MAALFFEPLESRQLLSGTFQLSAGGLLNIIGTSGDDAIILSQKGRRLTVSVNGQSKSFALKAIKKVKINCGAGDDSVTWSRGHISAPMNELGGAGDDTLWGSRGRDKLVGGDGVDMIDGAKEAEPGPPLAGADAQARLHGTTDYVGNGVYSRDGSGESVAGVSVIGFRSVSYDVKIENDGSKAQQFLVKVPGNDSKFVVKVYDSIKTGFGGGQSITDQATGAGWKTKSLAPGEFVEIRVDVSPRLAARGNDVNPLQVHVQSVDDARQADVVRLDTKSAFTAIPEIRRRNFDASGIYLATLQNEGNVADQYRVTGPAEVNGAKVHYFDAEHGGHDITAAVSGSGWLTRKLSPKDQQPFRVEIPTAAGEVRRVTVTATSTADASKNDFARFATEPRKTGSKTFIIGVWSQPTYNFDKWKRRGINTLVNYEGLSGTVSMDSWIAAANSRGLYQIRRPRENPADDKHEKLLLAWTGGDEPDIYSQSHQALKPNYDLYKSVNPDMPVVINFAGSGILGWGQFPLKRSEYEAMLPYMDWVSSGVYPVTGWDRPEHLDAPGRSVDRLQKWTEGKPQLAIIECGDQQLPWMPKTLRSATPAEFRAMVWDAIIRGAQGIIYFPFAFQPRFVFDNTPPEIEAEMIAQNKRIANLSKALVSPMDPPSLGLNLPAPLEGSWRQVGNKKFFIVMNYSPKTLHGAKIGIVGAGKGTAVSVQGESRSVQLSRGSISDSFGAYETHIYEID